MIAATYTQGGTFSIKQTPRPKIEADEILVRVKSSSICGTDIRTIRSGNRKLRDGQTIILGHEFAGVIEEAGKEVEGYSSGMRVGMAPNVGCGRCEMCLRGLGNMCPDYIAFGICMDGGHAEFVRIPHKAIEQGNVIPLSESLAWVEACLIEPLSCVVNGVRNCRINLGDRVVIFGAGPIGLMHIMLCNLSGASQIIMVDPVKFRLEQAKSAGASDWIDPTANDVVQTIHRLTDGRGVDVAITACPVSSVQQTALSLLAPYGRLSLFGGLPMDNSTVGFDANLIHYKNLVVTGVTGGSAADFLTAMTLIASKKVDIRRVISHVIDMPGMQKAFDFAMNGDAMKVVIQNPN